MHFTEGPLRQYERMMQEKPGHDHKPIKPVKKRDCMHCLHSDKHYRRCSKEKCILLEDEQGW